MSSRRKEFHSWVHWGKCMICISSSPRDSYVKKPLRNLLNCVCQYFTKLLTTETLILLLSPWNSDEHATGQWIEFEAYWVNKLRVPELLWTTTRLSQIKKSRGRDTQHQWATFHLSCHLMHCFIAAINMLAFSLNLQFTSAFYWGRGRNWIATGASILFLSLTEINCDAFPFNYRLMTLY